MSWAAHPQAGPDGGLRHLLTLDGLPRRHLEHLLRWAERYLAYLAAGSAQPAPGSDTDGRAVLSGTCVLPMFFDAEGQMPTSVTSVASRPLGASGGSVAHDLSDFEPGLSVGNRLDEQDACVRAALALGATVQFCRGSRSEALMPRTDKRIAEPFDANEADAPRRLIDWLPERADARYLILQHPQNGSPFLCAAHCAPGQQIVNAGDGSYAHPIRALCHVLEILQCKPALTTLRVAILGDIADSGIARSTLHALTTLGTPEIRVVGPTTLSDADIAHLGATWFGDPRAGLADMDATIVLPTWLPVDSPEAGHSDTQAVRFGGVAGVDESVARPASSLIQQAVWMAVFAVLAGCRDDDAGRVMGLQGGRGIDAPDDAPPPPLWSGR